MKIVQIFSWMQSKLNGNQRSSKPNTQPAKHNLMHETCKEEFNDWPSGLLAIGTFGNNNPKDPEKTNFPGEECPTQEHPEEIIHEEVREFHKEQKLLINKRSPLDSDFAEESVGNNLLPEKFFDFLRSFEDDRSTSEFISDNLTNEEGHHQGSTSSVHSKGKAIHMDRKNYISKRSLSSLLRKAFHRTGKSKLCPLIRDPLPELKLEKSRMEKILRTILDKKIYRQSSTPKASIKKCLDNKHLSETDSDDEMLENTNEGSKWVKTDSDYIVLEI